MVKANFEWISNISKEPYVSIDAMKRLYISKPARELADLPDGEFSLMIGFDHANKRIVLGKPEHVKPANNRPFYFDRRSYSKVTRFVDVARINDILPVRFYYSGKDFSDLPRGTHVFTLVGYESEDDG